MAGKRVNGSAAGHSESESGDVDNRTNEPDFIPPGVDESETGIPTVEPTDAEQPAEPSGKRKRGRPTGAKSSYTPRGTAAAEKEAANDLTSLLLSTHMMLAAITKVEELELDQNEAKRLGEAVARINKLYGGFVFSEKTMAWINLGMAGCSIYGPRAIAYSARMKKEREKKPVTIDAVGKVM
jgi:hypothetical protein